MKDTLIIGGNGYIGSALYQKIDADSVDLCLFGKDLGFSIKKNYNEYDISSYKNIILLSGHSSVKMSDYNKQNAWTNNVQYFYNLCEKLSPDQLLIYASSASVYGQNIHISKEEDVNLIPINHYDLTKISIDIIANKFINDGKNIIGLRFGTVNGKSLNIRSDLMLNSMFKSYRDNGFIQVKNTSVRRAILGMEDLTDGIISILDSSIKKSGQYNMCSFNCTVKEISNTFASITKCGINKIEDDVKQYDFEISSKKFETNFNFNFKETPKSIISNLLESENLTFSVRNDDLKFNLSL